MKLYILNENCVQGGRKADDDRSYNDCGDVTVYVGPPADLLEIADLREKHARQGGGGTFDRRVADTIREAVYAEHPELGVGTRLLP